MRIVVTGGSGFFGAHLLQALVAAGHTVTALTRAPRPLSIPGVRWITADLTDFQPLPLAGHTVCIHNALVWGAPERDLELLDLRASAHLFAEAARAGIDHLLYTSSTAVHRPWSPVMTAADAIGGTDLYGATKAGGEALLSALCHTHGLCGTLLRPGPIVDAPVPGAPFRLNARIEALWTAAERNEALEIAPGDGRQLIGAADLAQLYLAALSRPAGLQRWIAVAPRLILWADVAQQIITRLGRGRVCLTGPALHAPRFDVTATEQALGPVPDAGPALVRALDGRQATR